MSTTSSTTATKPSTLIPTSSTRLSAGCQQIVHEDFTDLSRATVTVRSTLADPDLWPQIENHKCHNVALTPSGLYADMASTVAGYIWRAWRGADATLPGLEVRDLQVDKTLIAHIPQTGREQYFEMECTLAIPPHSSADIIDGTVHCIFRETSATGTKLHDLAHCTVSYAFTYGWQADWAHFTPAIRSKIHNLHSRAQRESSGAIHLVHQQRAYELFASFVAYGPKYRNMSRVVYDTETLEATATLDFQPDSQRDYVGPYYLDGSCHLSGFVCNTLIDAAKWAYISHGIGAMKMTPDFDPTTPGARIENYVRMQPLPGDETVMCGDVWVLQDGEIVGLWEGVKFKRIPRRVLNVFLPQPKNQ